MVFECICVSSWQVGLACGQDLAFETRCHALNGMGYDQEMGCW